MEEGGILPPLNVLRSTDSGPPHSRPVNLFFGGRLRCPIVLLYLRKARNVISLVTIQVDPPPHTHTHTTTTTTTK